MCTANYLILYFYRAKSKTVECDSFAEVSKTNKKLVRYNNG